MKKSLLLNGAACAAVIAAAVAFFLVFQERGIEAEPQPHFEQKCVSQLMMIGDALHLYAESHASALPETLDQLTLDGQLSEPGMLMCPAEHLPYIYLGYGFSLAELSADIPLVLDHARSHPGGVHVLYADFQVRLVPMRRGSGFHAILHKKQPESAARKRMEQRVRQLDSLFLRKL